MVVSGYEPPSPRVCCGASELLVVGAGDLASRLALEIIIASPPDFNH
jgi:hypothetical protein